MSGRCWTVVTADGSPVPWQDDGTPHHPTFDSAVEEISGQLQDDWTDTALQCRPARCARPCVTAVCAGCEQPLEDDDIGGTVHYDDAAALDRDLTLYGWIRTDAGRYFCGCPDTPSTGLRADANRQPGPGQEGMF